MREEWMLNILIQNQYPMLRDTYKKAKYNKLQTINKRTERARGLVVIGVGNGHGDTSSNTGRGWLHFT